MNTSRDTLEVLERIYRRRSSLRLIKDDLRHLLSLDDPDSLKEIFGFADRIRREYMGEGILVRGIIEFSNRCRNSCLYCGLNRTNHSLERYRLSTEEILACAGRIMDHGIRTVVLQSGEDGSLDPAWLAQVIARIKSAGNIAVTLSLGEWGRQEFRMWKDAGADRYLLKIETSDKELYESLHPGMSFEERLACLDTLKDLGYQTGCGNIVGLPGQTMEHIAGDIMFFAQHEFDMIGIGPFIPHPSTALAQHREGDVWLTLKTLALTRIVTRNTHLPATTALGSVNGQAATVLDSVSAHACDARVRALGAGANVLMPNFTPAPFRTLYELYPGRECCQQVESMAAACARSVDYSRGDSLKRKELRGGACHHV